MGCDEEQGEQYKAVRDGTARAEKAFPPGGRESWEQAEDTRGTGSTFQSRDEKLDNVTGIYEGVYLFKQSK